MDKIPIQIGLLLFFISMIFFSQNGMEIKDIIIRSSVISLAGIILLQVAILFAAKSLGSSNERAGFAEDKKSAKENREGTR